MIANRQNTIALVINRTIYGKHSTQTPSGHPNETSKTIFGVACSWYIDAMITKELFRKELKLRKRICFVVALCGEFMR